MIKLALFLLTLASVAHAQTVINVSAQNFETSLNDAIENANGATVINLPRGFFSLQNEIIIDRPSITLRGQGMGQTVLSFKQQKAGPQGIIATRDQLTLEHFTVEDTFGNAIKTIGVKFATFRSLRVRWTRGPNRQNGAYGLYPVLSEDVLIENCDVSEASDAGIYVGQSDRVIVRNNIAHDNVAGIEIENTDNADVYGNEAYHNTAGILVFNLPDLVKKVGRWTWIHHNKVYSNNRKNFSTKGSIINLVPKGLGVFGLAAQQVRISHNEMWNNSISNVAISHYAISERPIKDPTFNPKSQGIAIHDNTFKSGKIEIFDGTQMNFIIKILAGLRSKDVVLDGIEDGTYEGELPRAEEKICINQKRPIRFANLHLDNQRRGLPFPGGPVTRSVKPHQCQLEAVVPVAPRIAPAPAPALERPTTEQILRVCKAQTQDVNWAAVEFDCPELADFNLFQDASDPTTKSLGGLKYLLNNQLFTDYASKDRFIFIPPGLAMEFRPLYTFEFPVGTIITKTFSVQEQGLARPTLMETRLLVRRASGWVPLNYVWDAATGSAKLHRAGLVVQKNIVASKIQKLKIDYHVPSLRQCASCHYINDQIVPIGPRAKFLNHSNQLTDWQKSGHLTGLPESGVPVVPAWDDERASIDARAKAYLDINCSHCHNPKGNARNTGLFLQTQRESDTVEMGHCKTPVAAGFGSGGNSYDVYPGNAKKSILMYRMTQSHLAVKMPQLGRSVSHVEGNKLVESWINQMKKVECK